MSIKLVGRAFEAPVESSTAKFVLVKLADNANDQGIAWPSVATIAADCSLSERAVRENLQRLERDGFIQIIRRRDGDTNLSNVYRLKLPPSSTVLQDVQGGDADVGTLMLQGGHPAASGVGTQVQAIRHSEPSIEPSGSRARGRAPAETLAADWKPSTDQLQYARDLGIPEDRIQVEVVKFRGYWVSGRGSATKRTPKGWNQSWMNWIGKAVDDVGRRVVPVNGHASFGVGDTDYVRRHRAWRDGGCKGPEPQPGA